MTRDELLAASREPNVAAYLRVIRACEGTAGDNGYRMQFGGELFDSFADHPRRLINKSGYASTAAGAYQFLERTWDGLVRQYQFPDFSPQWQDAAAVALLAECNALDVIRAGRLEEAVARTNRIWASLPGSPYGQPTRDAAFVRRVFDLYAQPQPAAPPAPVAAPQPQPESKPMAPVIAALLPSLVSLIPELGKLFGSGSAVSDRNIKAAEAVANVVVQATQAPNLQAAVETMQADPEARRKASDAVQAAWYTLSPGDGGGVTGARLAADKALSRPGWQGVVAAANQLAMDAAVVGGGGFVLWTVVTNPDTSSDIRSLIIGSIAGYIAAVVQYRYGSSVDSRRKTDMLAEK